MTYASDNRKVAATSLENTLIKRSTAATMTNIKQALLAPEELTDTELSNAVSYAEDQAEQLHQDLLKYVHALERIRVHGK